MAAAQPLNLTEESDAQLIERIETGDEAAFESLYERYFPRIFSFVNRRLGNRADTEETVQEVFINVFSSLGSYRGVTPFGAWVLGVSRRTIANRFKKKRHQTVPLEGDNEPENMALSSRSIHRGPTPLEVYECQERMNRLQDTADRQLSSEQQHLFEMHHLRHQSIHEIAVELNKSENAVKSHLYRARKLLLAI